METLEEEFMTGWYAVTKEANIKIHGHFNINDDEYMKEFLNRHAIKDTELPNTSGDAQEAGYESPAYTSPSLYDEMADNDITHSNASPPSGFKERKTECYQSESDDSEDIDQEAKFKLGQRIQNAILLSNQGYHHFKKAKKEFDALPAASHAPYNKHQAAYSKATEYKPTQEQLDAAGHRTPRSVSSGSDRTIRMVKPPRRQGRSSR
ncbi:hypothetical protein QFC21_007347 [Naganishia friedmannii]|uniref:Uncharacterized protein n=1 Tax=Naganishia friedmannii TaxID=89922 RepID=A0ACC2UV72_9TREE|nr:hypothetical protein QFC21_007347 [Naganishia friedmannii]